MTTAVRPMSSAEARDLALGAVAEQPGIQQRELAAHLNEATGLAESTLIKLLRRLEREGALEGGLDGRRKTYRLPSSQEASIADVVEDLLRDFPTVPTDETPAPGGFAAAQGMTAGTRRQLAALAAAIAIAAAIVAFVLAPTKDQRSVSTTGGPPPAASPR